MVSRLTDYGRGRTEQCVFYVVNERMAETMSRRQAGGREDEELIMPELCEQCKNLELLWATTIQERDAARKATERAFRELGETKERLVKRTDELIAERDRVLELQGKLLEQIGEQR